MDFLKGTGARIRTVLNLRKKDVNLKESVIHFQSNKGSLVLCFPVHVKLLPTLKKFLDEHPAPQSPFLIHSRQNPMLQMRTKTVCYQLKKITENAI
jgi:integrase